VAKKQKQLEFLVVFLFLAVSKVSFYELIIKKNRYFISWLLHLMVRKRISPWSS